MPQSSETITKTVEIEVPENVEQRARERTGEGEALEKYLLDEFDFEYEWVFESGREG